MGDIYGISNAVMEANSLHGQIALERQLAQEKYDTALDAFNKKIKDAKSKDTTDNYEEEGENVSTLNTVYQVGKGVYGGVGGAAAGASEAYSATRSGVQAGLEGADFLAESRQVAEGTLESGSVLRSIGAGVAGAATGGLAGLREAGGAATGFVKSAAGGGEGLAGLEGIVQKGLVKVGAGEELGFVAGKAAGAAGGLIAAGEQIDSLIESGGKSAFTRINDQGQRVAMSGTDKASEFLNEAGAGLDVLAAATGGLAVPLAAAFNLAGAITGVVGNIEDEKADDKAIGLKADGTTDSTKAPKLTAGPVTEAYTGLGFVGNVSHNPLAHIA